MLSKGSCCIPSSVTLTWRWHPASFGDTAPCRSSTGWRTPWLVTYGSSEPRNTESWTKGSNKAFRWEEKPWKGLPNSLRMAGKGKRIRSFHAARGNHSQARVFWIRHPEKDLPHPKGGSRRACFSLTTTNGAWRCLAQLKLSVLHTWQLLGERETFQRPDAVY